MRGERKIKYNRLVGAGSGKVVVTKRNSIVRVLSLAGAILCVAAPFARSQTEDPFSIRVESNLVLVHTEVYDKDRMHEWTPADRRCTMGNDIMFNQLRPSEPYLPKECEEVAIRGLSLSDFHVFEDGIEQEIESVRFEREAGIAVRDNFGLHAEWSHTPRSKWSSVDLRTLGHSGDAEYFYRVAYVPSKPEEGKCHRIRVTVDRPHAVVFASDQYCYTQHPATDPLNGIKFGKQLETDLDSDKRGKIPLSLQVSFFYTGAQAARVDLVLGFPWDHLKHEWVDLDLHAMIGVLGVVHKKDRTLVARFSDLAYVPGNPWFLRASLNPDLYPISKNVIEDLYAPVMLPSRYEAQIDLPAGEYNLRVVLSDEAKFGRTETTLIIDSYDGKQLAISSVVLCKRFRDAGAAAQEAAAANLAPRYVPLVSKGVQVTPLADTRFKHGEPLIAYFEVYEPLLSQQPKTVVQAHMRIFDAKTGEMKVDFPSLDAAPYERPGSTMIPIGDALVVSQLPKGDYRLEVQATDSAGRSTPWRTANFTLE
jgi:hypothetical protein